MSDDILDQMVSDIIEFLGCETPKAWCDEAVNQLPILLVDHANCEKKAASTAMNLMYRYIDKDDLLHKMSQLAREELLHFEQVLDIMRERDVAYGHVSPSRYAGGMRDLVRTHDPVKLVDTLIAGAFIEARSCERFAALMPYVDDELSRFYRSLLRSEGRHFKDYLSLAETYSEEPLDERITLFRVRENELILSADEEFRFHSGVPV